MLRDQARYIPEQNTLHAKGSSALYSVEMCCMHNFLLTYLSPGRGSAKMLVVAG
jgi:hypothetical protein